MTTFKFLCDFCGNKFTRDFPENVIADTRSVIESQCRQCGLYGHIKYDGENEDAF